jgi:hypothetical protein
MSDLENLTHRLLREFRAEMNDQFEALRSDISTLRDEVRENTKRLECVERAALEGRR